MIDSHKFHTNEERTVFENRVYKAPEKAEVYLSRICGDDMKLPPVEKRERHHHYTI